MNEVAPVKFEMKRLFQCCHCCHCCPTFATANDEKENQKENEWKEKREKSSSYICLVSFLLLFVCYCEHFFFFFFFCVCIVSSLMLPPAVSRWRRTRRSSRRSRRWWNEGKNLLANVWWTMFWHLFKFLTDTWTFRWKWSIICAIVTDGSSADARNDSFEQQIGFHWAVSTHFKGDPSVVHFVFVLDFHPMLHSIGFRWPVWWIAASFKAQFG